VSSSGAFVLRPSTRPGSPRARPRGDKPRTTEGDRSPDLAVKLFVLDVRAADLAASIGQFRSWIVKRDTGADRLARELYDLLLKPAEGEFAGATALVVVPDAVLWALPFHALQPRDGRYLIEDHAVSIAPSLASFVEMLRPAPASGPPGRGCADRRCVRHRRAGNRGAGAVGAPTPGREGLGPAGSPQGSGGRCRPLRLRAWKAFIGDAATRRDLRPRRRAGISFTWRCRACSTTRVP